MKALCSILLTFIACQAWASYNPDSGKTFRFICFETADIVNLQETDYQPGHAIIVELSEKTEYDASYFLEGNENYNPSRPIDDYPVIISAFQAAPDYREVAGLADYTQALLDSNQLRFEHHVQVSTFNKQLFSFAWGETFANGLDFSLSNPRRNSYVVNEGVGAGVAVPIFCKGPWAVG